jgi:predicted small lipoprotein YifL
VNRRFVIAGMLGLAAAACGRRGPLEPPPDSAQGREFARRRSAQAAPGQTPGSVRTAVENEDAGRTGVDLEGQMEARRAEGEPATPSAPGDVTPQITPAGGRRRPPGIVPPKRDFVLDPLLD